MTSPREDLVDTMRTYGRVVAAVIEGHASLDEEVPADGSSRPITADDVREFERATNVNADHRRPRPGEDRHRCARPAIVGGAEAVRARGPTVENCRHFTIV
jgi:hypothetical protein